MPLDFSTLPLAALAAIFVAAAGAVWFAGSRLSDSADALSERTGIGGGLIGALLLGGITSLPELATSLTAAFSGDADMAVNNLLGGIAMQVAVLAAADAALRDGALSARARSPVVLLQATLLILVLGLALGGIIIGEPPALPAGPWSAAILVATIAAFRILHGYEHHGSWRPTPEEGPPGEPRPLAQRPGRTRPASARAPSARPGGRDRTTHTLVVRTVLAGLVILAAGYTITRVGEAIAATTGLGSSFVGAALVAASTSIPELSTTIAAVRLGRYDMAFGNIFGANILDAGLVFVVDLAYDGPPVLGQLGDFALVAALLGILLTAIYLAAVIRGRIRRVGRLGVDSIAVLLLYLAGLYALFTLR